jgi:Type IV leader peptidase family.
MVDFNLALEISKFFIITLLFGIAAYKDIKEREVEDKIWILTLVSASPITFLQIFYLKSIKLVDFITSLILCFIFGLLLFYVAKFGGADAKALWVLPFVFPVRPQIDINTVLQPGYFLPFAVSVLFNAILLSVSYIFINIFKNLLWYIKNKELFKNYNINFFYKILLFILGEKVNKEKLIKNKFYISLFVNKNGVLKLELNKDVRDFDFNNLEARKGYYESESYWVENPQPFLLYFFISIYVTFLLGDIITYVSFLIARNMF